MFNSTKVREEIRGNSTGKKVQGKNTGKKVREKIREKLRGTNYGKKSKADRTSSGHVTLSLPVKKAPLGRILRNFRLRMRRTYLRKRDLRHFRSSMCNGPILLIDPPQMLLELCPYTTCTLIKEELATILTQKIISFGNW